MQYFQQLLGGQMGNAQDAFSGLLSGNTPSLKQSNQMFEESIQNPLMKQYGEQVLPQIEARFGAADAGSSSALNQALAQSSQDLSSTLAQHKMQFQNQFANQKQNAQQLQQGALGQLMQLLGQRTFEPIVQGPQGGLVKDLIGAGGAVTAGMATGGTGFFKSSREVKENIRDYSKGLDEVRKMEVKQYDYTIPMNGEEKDRVGLIAEDLPTEIQASIDGINGVDLYGLVAILLNAVKDLDANVKSLESKLVRQ